MRFKSHQEVLRFQVRGVLWVDGILLAGTVLLLSGDLRDAVLWVQLPVMVVVLLSIRFGGWDYDHVQARLVLASNLRGVLRAYDSDGAVGPDDKRETSRERTDASVIDDDSARAAEKLIQAHVVVQPQLGRRAEIMLDWLFVALGAAAGSAFTTVTRHSSSVLPTTTRDLLVPVLLAVAWFAGWHWVAPRNQFADYRAGITQLARDRPAALINSLPFGDKAFETKFHQDALAAARLATTERSELNAVATLVYGGSPPPPDWQSSIVHKIAWKSSQLIGGLLLGVILGVAA